MLDLPLDESLLLLVVDVVQSLEHWLGHLLLRGYVVLHVGPEALQVIDLLDCLLLLLLYYLLGLLVEPGCVLELLLLVGEVVLLPLLVLLLLDELVLLLVLEELIQVPALLLRVSLGLEGALLELRLLLQLLQYLRLLLFILKTLLVPLVEVLEREALLLVGDLLEFLLRDEQVLLASLLVHLLHQFQVCSLEVLIALDLISSLLLLKIESWILHKLLIDIALLSSH